MVFTLERAISLAAQAHEGQLDKTGQPYILHPLRVMLKVSSLCEQMTAILHDVLEDTTLTADVLKAEGCPEEVLEALDALTRRKGEKYLDEYILRIQKNPIAKSVKLSDLADNLNPARGYDNETLMERYRRAIKILA